MRRSASVQHRLGIEQRYLLEDNGWLPGVQFILERSTYRRLTID